MSPSSLSEAVTSFSGSNLSPTVKVLSSALIVGIALIGVIGVEFDLNPHIPVNLIFLLLSAFSALATLLSASYPLNVHTPSDTLISVSSGWIAVTVEPSAYFVASLGSRSVISSIRALFFVSLLKA